MQNASTRVVDAVAERKGVEPLELSTPLYDAVDADALDRLLEADSVEVTFTFAGHVVTARSSGDVRAKPLDDAEHATVDRPDPGTD